MSEAMAKFKICPACGEMNPPALLECRRCEADLTGIRLADFCQPADSGSNAADLNEAVRICECGHENPISFRKCEKCGEEISDILPTIKGENFSAGITLEAVDGGYCYKLATREATIGRDREMSDYLSSKSFVSRVHAKMRVSENGVFIENLSRTNFTYINNQRIPDGEEAQLNDGDEVGFGGNFRQGRQENAAYFRVRIKCI
ncbi:MAG: FHA domain-containing protein [Oscillospiraceae bacterium]